MEKEKITKRILNLTLEIIYLLTGQDYILVKKSSERLSGGWSITRDRIAVPLFHSLIRDRKKNEKILDLNNKIIELLTAEDYVKDLHDNMLEKRQCPGGDENPKVILERKRFPNPSANYPERPLERRLRAAKDEDVLEMIPKKNRRSGKTTDGSKEKIHSRGVCSEETRGSKMLSSSHLLQDGKEGSEATSWEHKVENSQTAKEKDPHRLQKGKELVRVKIKEEETPTVISPDAEVKGDNSGYNVLTRAPPHHDTNILGKLNTEQPEDHSQDGSDEEEEEEEEDWLLVKIKEENVATEITSEQFNQYLQELQRSKQTSRRMSGAGPSSSDRRIKQSIKLRAKPFSKNELIDMVQFLDEQGYEHTTAGHVHQKKSSVLNQLSNLLYEKHGTMHSKRQIQKRYSDLKTREQWRLASIRRKILRVKMLRSESEMLPATFIEDNADTENNTTDTVTSQEPEQDLSPANLIPVCPEEAPGPCSPPLTISQEPNTAKVFSKLIEIESKIDFVIAKQNFLSPYDVME